MKLAKTVSSVLLGRLTIICARNLIFSAIFAKESLLYFNFPLFTKCLKKSCFTYETVWFSFCLETFSNVSRVQKVSQNRSDLRRESANSNSVVYCNASMPPLFYHSTSVWANPQPLLYACCPKTTTFVDSGPQNLQILTVVKWRKSTKKKVEGCLPSHFSWSK